MSSHLFGIRATVKLPKETQWDLFVPFTPQIAVLEAQRDSNNPNEYAKYAKFVRDLRAIDSLKNVGSLNLTDKFTHLNIISGYPGDAQMGAIMSCFVHDMPFLKDHMDDLWDRLDKEKAMCFFLIQQDTRSAKDFLQAIQEASKMVGETKAWLVDTDALDDRYLVQMDHPDEAFQKNLPKQIHRFRRTNNTHWTVDELGAFRASLGKELRVRHTEDQESAFEESFLRIAKNVRDQATPGNKERSLSAIRGRMYLDARSSTDPVFFRLLNTATRMGGAEGRVKFNILDDVEFKTPAVSYTVEELRQAHNIEQASDKVTTIVNAPEPVMAPTTTLSQALDDLAPQVVTKPLSDSPATPAAIAAIKETLPTVIPADQDTAAMAAARQALRDLEVNELLRTELSSFKHDPFMYTKNGGLTIQGKRVFLLPVNDPLWDVVLAEIVTLIAHVRDLIATQEETKALAKAEIERKQHAIKANSLGNRILELLSGLLPKKI